MTLHVTDGDILAERLQSTGAEGYILPWHEVLHEGILTDYQSVDGNGRHQFNLNRATFIESRGWGYAQNIIDEMNNRDAMLLDPHWKEIVLWLEPDLFDQLILAQVLTLLARSGRFQQIDLRLVQVSRHLNYLTDTELVHAGRMPRTLVYENIVPYLKFWVDVTHGVNVDVEAAAPESLRVAQRQWKELQPGADGLSVFDRRVLEMVQRRGAMNVDVLFQQINAEEGDAAFWDDTSFMSRITDLARKVPWLYVHDDVLECVQ